MGLGVYLYDAFTDHPFGGNAAGVVLDAATLDPQSMQRIAAELNAPTTGFLVGCEDGPLPTFLVRYFTPRREIALCGHATVAVFSALAGEGRCEVQPQGACLLQRTSAGEFPVLLYPAEEGAITVEMEQRLPYFASPAVRRPAVQQILGNVPLHPSLPVEIASTGLRHLVVPFAQVADLADLNPDFRALARLSRTLHVDTVCAVALPPEPVPYARIRDFCSGIGADEEPASGTTAAAVTCYLAKHRRIAAGDVGELNLRVEQGVEMGRPSWIHVRLTHMAGVLRRVSVRGRAIKTLTGELHCEFAAGQRTPTGPRKT